MRAPVRIRVLLAGLVPLLATLACSGVTGPHSNVQVVLSATNQATAAPAASDNEQNGSDALAQLDSANVTFASFLARNSSGQLVSLGLNLPMTIDVVALLKGGGLPLPAGTLPAGDYDQIVVVMTQVELALTNGGRVAVTPPGGGWTSVVPVTPFTVVDGQDMTIELNLHLGGAFRSVGSSFGFYPQFEGHHHDR